MNKKVKVEELGIIDFQKCWKYQEVFFEEILKIKSTNRKTEKKIATKNYLIFCEHPHVYTLGKSGNENNLLVNKDYLKAKGATFYKINRGGDITYHGPGQIVGYPILDLDNFFTDIHKYLRLLEESVILTLKDYGIKAERSKGETGVWLDVGSENARKICAFGVKSSRWVTMHGFSFNVNPELNYFKNIIPCGITDKGVTSVSELKNRNIEMNEIKQILYKNFAESFSAKLVFEN